MNHLDSMAAAEAKMAALEALRGTPSEPPALDGLIGQYRRTREWHAVRLDQDHPNVGTSSLYERSGRSKRVANRRDRINEMPLSTLALA